MKKNQEKTSPNTTNGGYKPYKSYNESGVEWFKKIPTHWEPVKLAYFLKKNQSGTWGDAAEEDGEIILRSTEQTVDGNWDIENPARRDITEQEYQETKLIAEDLLLTTSSGSKDHIGKTSLVTQEIEERGCSFSNFMQRLRPKDSLSSPFLNYLLNSPISREQFKYFQSSTTGLGNLNSSLIDQLRIPKPPSKEQKAIVKFLGHETSKIDRLIEKKEKLIDLLEEKRSSIIALKVTRGVSSNKDYQNSSIEWIEEIPSNWKEEKLKQTVKGVINGKWGSEPENDEETTTCIRVADFDFEHIRINNSDLTERVISEDKKQNRLLEKGDLLFEKSGGGDKQPVGRVVLYALDLEEAVTSNFIGKMPVREGYNSQFLAYLHKTLYEYGVNIKSIKQTTGIQNIDSKQYLDEKVPIPPKHEQKEIISFLDSETSKLDSLIKKIKNGIEKLKEYRTALISAAVTGKIDVRGEVE